MTYKGQVVDAETDEVVKEIEAAKAWPQITLGTRERKALTEAEINALHDKLGGRPVVATYNESKRKAVR